MHKMSYEFRWILKVASKIFLTWLKPFLSGAFIRGLLKFSITLTKSIVMKSKMQRLFTVYFLLISVILFSCKKEASVQNEPVTEEESVTITEENASADAAYDDVTEMGLSAGADLEVTAEAGSTEIQGNGSVDGSVTFTGNRLNLFEDLAHKLGPCAEIKVSPNDSTFPKTVVINYGDGCICRDGKFRKGAIVLHFSGPIRRPGSVLTITFRNYHVNRAHIEGTKTIKNLSAEGVHKFSVHVENGKVTWPNGRGFKYESAKVVTQVRGMDTRIIRDDVYEIEKRNKTIYANGTIVVKNTETPLIKKIGCPWLVKGILKIKINDRVLFLDYGNGECDNKAILKWHGGEKEIKLP